MRRLLPLACFALLALGAIATFAPLGPTSRVLPMTRGQDQVAKVTATPIPPTPIPSTPSPAPTASPTTLGPLAQGTALLTAVEQVHTIAGDNHALFGGPSRPINQAAANRAVNLASDALNAFLNAQFVNRDTMFSEAGIAVLVAPGALDQATREALGLINAGPVNTAKINRDTILGTRTGSASAVADVLIDGDVVQAVTLRYASTVDLVTTEGEGPVSHVGVITFVPVDGALQMVAIQPTTTFGGNLGDLMS